jgi:hypothetical protein
MRHELTLEFCEAIAYSDKLRLEMIEQYAVNDIQLLRSQAAVDSRSSSIAAAPAPEVA